MESRIERNENQVAEPGDALNALLASVSASQPFGPAFFLSQLRGLVRDHCPAPGELPRVEVHLQSGESLEVCHVVGLAPLFLAVAVAETAHPTSMRLEIFPYQAISRVTISSSGREPKGMGFDVDHRPAALAEQTTSAEALLSIAAQSPRGGNVSAE
jgi:hypothetical protein